MKPVHLHNAAGDPIGTMECPPLFEEPVNQPVLWQAIRMYQANQRQGNADTKTRAEVSGGGRKPWKQKHTGRARAGSIRSPLWRKGGIVFGPHPREHRYALPRALRRRALIESLKARLQDEAVLAVESLAGMLPKTKSVGGLLSKLKVKEKALLVVERLDPLLTRICRNLPDVEVRVVQDLTCYDVLVHPTLVVTKGALEACFGGLKK